MTVRDTKAWQDRLLALGRQVRDAVVTSRQHGAAMTEAVGREGGDTIFAIDRHVEPVLVDAIERWPDPCRPLSLIAEGLGENGRCMFGRGEPRYQLIIDPIDGTRNIMYDKRSAWFIAAVGEPGGSVADAFASVMVELPTSKAGYADCFTATRRVAAGRRESLHCPEDVQPLVLKPSRAGTLLHGFGHVVNFFPGTKQLAAELMQQIVEATIEPQHDDGASVFDDQYISTAGQFVELIMGRDRFCADLRPLFHRLMGRTADGLECHPYDVAGMLVAQQAGVILTDGFGMALRPPMDVHSGVHWCGYANDTLRRTIEPVIARFFRERGLVGGFD